MKTYLEGQASHTFRIARVLQETVKSIVGIGSLDSDTPRKTLAENMRKTGANASRESC